MKAIDKAISRGIMDWSKKNPRSMPWKGSKNPYKIWISEIILQQTRVEQGIPYYNRFIKRFPRIQDLAATSLDNVLKMWEGLGYYRRAKHLHETAIAITQEFNGIFPSDFKQIEALKGIGPYTAAAIASFAFDLPHVVIDGNVSRVVSRLFSIKKPIDSTEGKANVERLANRIFCSEYPAAFNQAIMDFGALQCKPANPPCSTCNLCRLCQAHQQGLVASIPSKKPKKKRRARYFHYVIINTQQNVWIRKREGKDIWQHLYEFYLVEKDQPSTWSGLEQDLDLETSLISISDIYEQTLTHQKIYATFVEVNFQGSSDLLLKKGYEMTSRKKIRNFAFPKIIDCYLMEKSVNLI